MKKRMIVIGILLLLILAMSTTVSAQVVRISVSATETLLEILDPGENSAPGGNQHFRGMVEYLRVDSDSDFMAGYNTVVANGNLGADGFGQVWGSNTLELAACDGYWEGHWVGQVDENGMTLQMQGRGYGDLSGYLIKGTYVNGVLEAVITQLPNP
jgi:hypothetical protein